MFRVTVSLFLCCCLVWLTTAASLDDRDVIVGNEGLNATDDLESKSKSGPLYYMNDNCGKRMLFNTREQIRFAPWSTKYPPTNIACIVRVTRQDHYPKYRYVVTFKLMQMTSSSSGGYCVHSRLDMYSGTDATLSKLISGHDGICGKKSGSQEYTTDTNSITLRFTTNELKPKTFEFFEAIITPYHVGTCRHDEFRCKNGRCVKNDLLCNGYNNCGDDSDEKSCAALLLSVAAIAGIVVGCVVVIGCICSIVICKCCCGAFGYERF